MTGAEVSDVTAGLARAKGVGQPVEVGIAEPLGGAQLTPGFFSPVRPILEF